MEIAGTAAVRDRKGAPGVVRGAGASRLREGADFARGLPAVDRHRGRGGRGEGGTGVASGGDSARGDAGGGGRLKRMQERGFGLSARDRRLRSEEEADADEGGEGAAAMEESDDRLLQFADICLKIYPPNNSYQSDLKIPREAAPPVPRDDIFLAGDESTSPNSPTQLQPQTMNVWFRPHGLAAYSSSMSLSSEESEAENGSLGINSDIKSIVDAPSPPNSPPLMSAVRRPSNSFTQLHPHRNAMNRSCVTFLSKESKTKSIAHATSSEIKPAVENRPDEVAKLDPSLSLIRSRADIEAPARSAARIHEEALESLEERIAGANGRWAEDEHARFLSAILRHGRDWIAVAACVGTRTPAQVRSHARNYAERTEDDGPRKRPGGRPEIPRRKNARTGRWTKEEHRLFVAAYRRHGRDWKEVTADVKTRTQLQVRTHAQKYLSPTTKDGLRKGRWTKKECQLFVDAYRRHGRDWRKVAADVKTRTKLQVRTHAQKYLSRLEKDAEMNGNVN